MNSVLYYGTCIRTVGSGLPYLNAPKLSRTYHLALSTDAPWRSRIFPTRKRPFLRLPHRKKRLSHFGARPGGRAPKLNRTLFKDSIFNTAPSQLRTGTKKGDFVRWFSLNPKLRRCERINGFITFQLGP